MNKGIILRNTYRECGAFTFLRWKINIWIDDVAYFIAESQANPSSLWIYALLELQVAKHFENLRLQLIFYTHPSVFHFNFNLLSCAELDYLNSDCNWTFLCKLYCIRNKDL